MMEDSGSTPEAGEGGRVARYAEALRGGVSAVDLDTAVRAVMAVADQETAELRAEVEHWKHHAWEAGEGFKLAIEDAVRAGARRRAAEAESARLAAVVAKVEALADLWERHSLILLQAGTGVSMIAHDDVVNHLRAALASVAPDTATPGEVCSTCGQSMDSPPCSRSADGSMSGHTIGGGANKCEATR